MKKQILEQALTDIDPTFVAEAGAHCTSAAVRRPVWKRTLLVAACLVLAFAITAGASGLCGDWKLWFITGDTGNREMAGEFLYGGTELPEESKQLVREKAAEQLDENGLATIEFDFRTLDELEAFLGMQLIRSSLYPVSTEERICCTVLYHCGYKMGDKGVYPFESFSGFCDYAFDTGVWNPNATKIPSKITYDMSVRFQETNGSGSFKTSDLVTDDTEFLNRELPALSVTASIATHVNDSSFVFFAANGLSYNIYCMSEPDVPVKFMDSLY